MLLICYMNNKYFKYYQRDSKAICHLIPKQFTTGYNVEKTTDASKCYGTDFLVFFKSSIVLVSYL